MKINNEAVKELAEIIIRAWRSKITNEAVLQMAKDILASGYLNKKNIKLTAIASYELSDAVYKLLERQRKNHKSIRKLSVMDFLKCASKAQLAHNLKEIGK